MKFLYSVSQPNQNQVNIFCVVLLNFDPHPFDAHTQKNTREYEVDIALDHHYCWRRHWSQWWHIHTVY